MEPHFERYSTSSWIRHPGEPNFGFQTTLAARLPTLQPPMIEDEIDPLQQIDVQDALMKAETEANRRISEIETRSSAKLKEAELEVAKWRAHALKVESEASQRGHDEGFASGKVAGYEAGLHEAKAATQPMIDRLNSMVQSTIQSVRQTIVAAEEQIAELTIELAQIMLGEAIAANPDLLARRILRLLDGINSTISAQVRMCPDDITLIQPIWQESLKSVPFVQDIRFIADPSVQSGGCIIETKTHFIDAQISSLVERITEVFDEQEDRDPLAFQVGAA